MGGGISVKVSLCQGEVNPDVQPVGQEKPVTEQWMRWRETQRIFVGSTTKISCQVI